MFSCFNIFFAFLNIHSIQENSKDIITTEHFQISEKVNYYQIFDQNEAIKQEIAKQKQKANYKIYYEKNKEKLKAKSLEYIRSHQEQVNEQKKQFYEENKQFCLDRLKKYREENREKYHALCLARYKIRCQTDPSYQENLAKKRRERDLKN